MTATRSKTRAAAPGGTQTSKTAANLQSGRSAKSKEATTDVDVESSAPKTRTKSKATKSGAPPKQKETTTAARGPTPTGKTVSDATDLDMSTPTEDPTIDVEGSPAPKSETKTKGKIVVRHADSDYSASPTQKKKAAAPARAAAKKGKASGKAAPAALEVDRPFVVGQCTTLFDLPAELRNDIWTMLLVQDKPIEVSSLRPYVKEPALLAVNRQMRSETMSIWYAENDFQVLGSSPAVKFLRSRDDQQLRSMRSLRVSTEKSKEITEAPKKWYEHVRSKVDTLMREFEPRGLRRVR